MDDIERFLSGRKGRDEIFRLDLDKVGRERPLLPSADATGLPLPLVDRHRKYKEMTIEEAADFMHISRAEIRKLIELGDLEVRGNRITTNFDSLPPAFLSPGKVLYLFYTPEEILNSRDIDVIEKKAPFKQEESLGTEADLETRLQQQAKHLEILFAEFKRFAPHVPLDIIMIYGISIDPETNREFNIRIYSKKQILDLVKNVGTDNVRNAVWGTQLLLEQEMYIDNAVGMIATDIAAYLGIANNQLNRRRILVYESRDLLVSKEFGVVASLMSKLQFKDETAREEMDKELSTLWLDYYSNAPEIQDYSKVAGRTGLKFIEKGLDLRTTEQDIERFLSTTVLQRVFAREIFEELPDYFGARLDNVPLPDLLNGELLPYAKTRLAFLEPITRGGLLRYHSFDTRHFKTLLEESCHFEDLKLGIKIKQALRDYREVGEKGEGILGIEDIANELGTNPAKAASLSLGGYFLPLAKFAEANGKTYAEVARFYEDFIKARMEISRSSWRTTRASLEEFKKGTFAAARINIREANEELRRQYGLDAQFGRKQNDQKLFPDALDPFLIDGRLVNTQQDIEEIERILAADPDFRRRIEWGLALRDFYSDPKTFEGYVGLEEYRAELGLTEDKQWLNVRKHLTAVNPALKRLEKKAAEEKNGEKSISPAEFDERYFSANHRQYTTRKRAYDLKNEFKSPDEVSALLTGIPADFTTLSQEGGLDVIGKLPMYRVRIGSSEKETYLRYDITALKTQIHQNLRYKNLQTALALRTQLQAAESDQHGCSTFEETADKLGISVEDVQKLVSRRLLKTEDIGLATRVKRLLEDSVKLTADDIYAFCERDARYKTRVVRLDGIKDPASIKKDCYELETAKELVAGRSWLAKIVFSHYTRQQETTPFDNVEPPIILTIDGTRYMHEFDVGRLEALQRDGRTPGLVKQEIVKKLGVAELNRRYEDLNRIVVPLTPEAIDVIAKRVDDFKRDCYDWQQIGAAVGAQFTNEALFDAIMVATISNVLKFSGKYASRDIQSLDLSLTKAAQALGLITDTVDASPATPPGEDGLRRAKRSVANLVNANYISLHSNGLKTPIEDLVAESYESDAIKSISYSLNGAVEQGEMMFRFRDKRYCPRAEVAKIFGSRFGKILPDDITQEGMAELLRWNIGPNGRGINWDGYIKQECGKQGDPDKFARNLTRYMIKHINQTRIAENDEPYTPTVLFEELAIYAKFLVAADIQGLMQLKAIRHEGRPTIDPNRSFYTAKEVYDITGKNPAAYGADSIGNDGITLYSARTAADIARMENGNVYNPFTDPLEILALKVMISDKKCIRNPAELASMLKIDTRHLAVPVQNRIFYEIGKSYEGKARSHDVHGLIEAGKENFLDYVTNSQTGNGS